MLVILEIGLNVNNLFIILIYHYESIVDTSDWWGVNFNWILSPSTVLCCIINYDTHIDLHNNNNRKLIMCNCSLIN